MKRFVFVPLLFCGLLTAVYPLAAEEAMTVLRQDISATPNSAAAMVTRTLKAAGVNAASTADAVTLAAIQGLGPHATSKQIAAVVYASVRAVPESALQIVRVAVHAAPKAAPDIAAAAALAVPNPWKEVSYQRGTPPPVVPVNVSASVSRKEPDFKSSKEPDFKSPVHQAFLNPAQDPTSPAETAGDPMSLAEAIVQAAVNADPGVDAGAVQAAVDMALFGDPGQLFNAVAGARGISGVGDAGNSNYANEPFRRLPQTTINDPKKTPPVAPVTPDPSPVSR
jgi:hypothetical protein